MPKRFVSGLGEGLGRALAKGLAGIVLLLCLLSAYGGLTSLLQGRPALRGELVDIGGRKLRVVCEGPRSARPLVMLEAGLYGFAADWREVQRGLAADGWRSCAYDRAGLGFSDTGPAPRDSAAIGGDLEALLRARGEAGPVILVGHSMAGLHTRLFVLRHPGRVKALVLVDAVSPDAPRRMLQLFDRVGVVGRALSALGLMKPFMPVADAVGVSGGAHREKQFFFADRGHNRASAEEARAAWRSAIEVREAGRLDPDLPVGVVTEGSQAELQGRWGRERTAPAKASRRGLLETIPDANHASMLGRDHARVIVRMIERTAASAGIG